MAKNEAIAKAIATDPYLKERKSPTAVDQQLYLKEVSFVCPLCGKILRHRKQKKANKLYEIAHIFPNSPTEEQYEQLSGLPRLGDNSESFENKIALCKDCHDQQDYHTTQADYLKLLDIKQHLLKLTDLHEAMLTMGLEQEIADVVKRVCSLHEDEIGSLNYTPVILTKKFAANELLLKNRIKMNVTNYYPYIRDCFKELEAQLQELVQNPNLSKVVLTRHAELLREKDRMQKENDAYEKLQQLKEARDADAERLKTIKQRQLALISYRLNEEMSRLNDAIYEGSYNAPILDFTDTGYDFFTPDDTGTGIAYKGLVVYDLAVLSLTKLPILVHDSVVLKQISDDAIEKIIELYSSCGKQVIIALDKQDSYSEKTSRLLGESAVLRLSSNGQELFGRSWG